MKYLFSLIFILLLLGCVKNSTDLVLSGTPEKLQKKLLDGYDVNTITKDSISLLALAIKESKVDIASLLMKNDAKLIGTKTDNIILYALEFKNRKMVESLLKHVKIISEDDRLKVVDIAIENDWINVFKQISDSLSLVKKMEIGNILDTYNSPAIKKFINSQIENVWLIDNSTISTEMNSHKGLLFKTALQSFSSEEIGIKSISSISKSDQMVVKLSSKKSFKSKIETLLSNPDTTQDGWISGLKSSYFNSVVVPLPKFISTLYRHEGYYSPYDKVPLKNQLVSFLVHRLNRNQHVISWLWKSWKDEILDNLSTEQYVNLDYAKTTEGLIETWEYISKKDDYEKLLSTFFDSVASDESSEWYSVVPNELQVWHNSNLKVSEDWAISFWMRRFKEKNHNVVLSILKEIDENYKNDRSIEEYKKTKKINEARDEFIRRARCCHDIYTIKRTVNTGADISGISNIKGIRSIHEALLTNNLELVESLLTDSIEEIRSSLGNGENIYSYATSCEAIDILFSYDIPLEANQYATKPLELFIYEKRADLIDCIIDKGFSVKAPKKYGGSYFKEIDIEKPSEEEILLIKVLLEQGADPKIKDGYPEKRPIDIAHPEIKEMMVKAIDE